MSLKPNEIESLYALRALMTNAASAADSRLFQQKCIMHRQHGGDPTVVKYEFLRLGNSPERALRATGKGRSLGRASARWLVIKVPPCTIIPESGYPFSGGTRATIKLLLLARTLLSRRRPTDQIYFAVPRRGESARGNGMASSDDSCGECNRAFLPIPHESAHRSARTHKSERHSGFGG